jgi:hypothetical protein
MAVNETQPAPTSRNPQKPQSAIALTEENRETLSDHQYQSLGWTQTWQMIVGVPGYEED